MNEDNILDTEFSEPFVKAMKNRMIVSYFKYGRVRDAVPDKIDAIASAHQRIEKYLATGNTEFLIDAGNFIMMEFMYPRLKHAFFKATDSDESPGRTTTTGEVTTKENKDIDL